MSLVIKQAITAFKAENLQFKRKIGAAEGHKSIQATLANLSQPMLEETRGTFYLKVISDACLYEQLNSSSFDQRDRYEEVEVD